MNDEIRPPAWAVDGARRLSLPDFGQEFTRRWAGVRKQCVKSECWQTYQEPDTRSWQEYQLGNYEKVPDLLDEEARQDLPIYEDAVRNRTPFVRVRLVTLPISQYLTFEMWNYVVRARFGETVEIVVVPADDPRPLPNHSHFDFLLFDDQAALVHDYGLDGLQVGGWVTTVPGTLRRLAETADEARTRATPLDAFLARHNLVFPPR